VKQCYKTEVKNKSDITAECRPTGANS